MKRTYCVEIYKIEDKLLAYMPKLDICEKGYHSIDEVVHFVKKKCLMTCTYSNDVPESDTYDAWEHLSGKYREENLIGLFMMDVEF